MDARAQDFLSLSLEQLLDTPISVASKTEESNKQAPGIITVVTRQEIEGFQARNLGDILNRVPGMQLLSPDVFMDQSVVIRGQEWTPYNNHILILLNGRPLRDPISGGMNAVVWAAFPVAAIDHLEIIRGPGSVLYGSAAFSGVVNIVTHDVEVSKVAATVATGSQGRNVNDVTASYKDGDFSLLTSLHHQQDQGPIYSFTDYAGLASSDNFSRQANAITSTIRWRELEANIYYAEWSPYSLSGSETWNPDYLNDHEATLIDLGWSHRLQDEAEIAYNLTFNKHRWLGTRGVSQATSSQHELLYRLAPMNKMSAIVGGGFEQNDWGGAILHDDRNNSYFLYSQVDYQLSDSSSLIMGAQWNKIDSIDGNLSTRVGWLKEFTSQVTFKLLYSEAFRKAYPLETGFDVVVFRGNSELEPETINTWESQVIVRHAQGESAFTLFNSQMENLITREYFPDSSVPRGFYLQYINVGEWSSQGVEYEGKYRLSPRLQITSSLTYQTNKNDRGVEHATLHPSTLAKMGILYDLPRVSVGLHYGYASAAYSTRKINSNSAIVNPEATANHLMTLKLSSDGARLFSRTSAKKIKLSVEVDNLLNEDFYYSDYPNKQVNTLMPIRGGRTYLLSLGYEF